MIQRKGDRIDILNDRLHHVLNKMPNEYIKKSNMLTKFDDYY